MAKDASHSTEREQRLGDVLGAYFVEVEEGRAPSREELLDRHPDLAPELSEFFAEQDRLEGIIAPLRDVGHSTEVDDADPAQVPTVPIDGEATVDVCADPEATTWPFAEGDGPVAGTEVLYFGDFELIEEIARGGMGIVFKARQVSLNRLVALKMILAGRLASGEDLKRFRNEAEAVANLDHPNIVPIYEVGEHDGCSYFAMKLIEGGSLAQRLPAYADDPKSTVRLIATVARAIHHAHQRGVLHRDLKPSNILLDLQGEPHVTDFGLAKRLEGDSDLTRSGSILGSPPYMAPEQASGRMGAVTTATDVYGLGAVLYAMLTGRPPFQADSVVEILEQVKTCDVDPPSSLNRRVDRDLQTICLKCLDKNPQRRYHSAAELAAELDRWLGGEPIAARPVGWTERTWRWCRRNPVVSGLTTALAVLLVAGLIVLSVGMVVVARQRDDARDQRRIAVGERKRAEAGWSTARKERDVSDGRLYVARIRLAQQAWESGDVGQTRELLDSLRPAAGRSDRRNWEWSYLDALCRADLRTIDDTPQGALRLAWSPDGTRIASAGQDGWVKVWEAGTGRRLFARRVHISPVHVLAWSPDGTRIATGGEDGARIWDVERGTLASPSGRRPVRALAWSRDGEQLDCVTLTKDLVHIARDGKETQERLPPFSDDRTMTFFYDETAWSPDRRRLAHRSATRGTGLSLTVRDAETGVILFTTPLPINQIPRLAWSPEGRRLAWVDHWRAGILDGSDGREHLTLPARLAIAWSPDGTRLAAASSRQTRAVVVIDAETGKEVLLLRGHIENVCAVAWSPDGTRLASSDGGAIKLWDARLGQESVVLARGDAAVNSLSWHPDNRRLASGAEGARPAGSPAGKADPSAQSLRGLSIWDVPARRKIPLPPFAVAGVYSVEWSPDGRRLAWSSSGIPSNAARSFRIWDLDPRHDPLILTDDPQRLRPYSSSHSAVAWSPDGRRLASGGDGLVTVWDAATGQPSLGFQEGESIAWSPDGTRLATADSLGESAVIHLHDAATGRALKPLCRSSGGSLARPVWSPDGRRVAWLGEVGTVRVSNVATGEESLVLHGHGSVVSRVVWSPDGSRLATAGGQDATLRIWDASTGEELLRLPAHAPVVHEVAWSPDGKRIASAGVGEIKLWETSARSASPPTTVERSAERRHAEAFSYLGYARSLESSGWLEDAEEAFLRAVEGLERLASDYPTREDFAEKLATAELSLGSLLLRSGRDEEGLKRLRRSLEIGHRLAEETPASSQIRRQLVDLSGRAVEALLKAGPSTGLQPALRDAFSGALEDHRRLAADFPDLVGFGAQANSILNLARALFAAGQHSMADQAYRLILARGEAVNTPQSTNSEMPRIYNDVAWFRATCPEERYRNPAEAVALATKAVRSKITVINPRTSQPVDQGYWNTLGVAQYRAGAWGEAIDALSQSVEQRGGGDAFDWFFLAMAHWQKDDQEESLRWYHKAARWMDTNRSTNEELARFRAEAATLLGLRNPTAPVSGAGPSQKH
jgi:WD40 repeat protein